MSGKTNPSGFFNDLYHFARRGAFFFFTRVGIDSRQQSQWRWLVKGNIHLTTTYISLSRSSYIWMTGLIIDWNKNYQLPFSGLRNKKERKTVRNLNRVILKINKYREDNRPIEVHVENPLSDLGRLSPTIKSRYCWIVLKNNKIPVWQKAATQKGKRKKAE